MEIGLSISIICKQEKFTNELANRLRTIGFKHDIRRIGLFYNDYSLFIAAAYRPIIKQLFPIYKVECHSVKYAWELVLPSPFYHDVFDIEAGVFIVNDHTLAMEIQLCGGIDEWQTRNA